VAEPTRTPDAANEREVVKAAKLVSQVARRTVVDADLAVALLALRAALVNYDNAARNAN
jgi:hypothetical protein